MPLYRNGRKVILFVHIPKTGGSTVEEVLKAAGAAQALKYHKRLGYSNSTPQHMPWEVTKRWVPREFYDFAFTVVREPVARMASEYRWRGKISTEPLPAFDDWANRQMTLWKEKPYLLDNHIRPQADFVGPSVRVFKLEDGLDEPIRIGLKRLGLATVEVSIHHARKSEVDELVVSPTTLARIKRFYETDYETFGYDRDTSLPTGLALPSSTVSKLF